MNNRKKIIEKILKNCYLCIYKPLCTSRIWHKFIFLTRSLTGLNFEFSFSYTGYHTKIMSPLGHIGGVWITGYIPFPWLLPYMKYKHRCPGFDLRLPCSFPITIIITQWTHPEILLFIDFLLQTVLIKKKKKEEKTEQFFKIIARN